MNLQRLFINIILVIVAAVSLAWCAVADGLQWFIGLIPLLASCLGILKLNTDVLDPTP